MSDMVAITRPAPPTVCVAHDGACHLIHEE